MPKVVFQIFIVIFIFTEINSKEQCWSPQIALISSTLIWVVPSKASNIVHQLLFQRRLRENYEKGVYSVSSICIIPKVATVFIPIHLYLPYNHESQKVKKRNVLWYI